MRTYLAVLFLFLASCFSYFSGSKAVFADEIVANAGILPTIWYSTTSAYAGDTVTIYGGIQNHSDSDISGTATFYVDTISTGKTSFVSHSESLMEVSYPWHAALGKHTIQIKLTVPMNILSTDSNSTSLTVLAAPIGINLIQLPAAIPAVITKEVNNIDSFANSMASTVQSLKITSNTANQKDTIKKGTTKDSASALAAISGSTFFKTIYNTALDWLIFIIHHWVWTILVILVIIVIIRFF